MKTDQNFDIIPVEKVSYPIQTKYIKPIEPYIIEMELVPDPVRRLIKVVIAVVGLGLLLSGYGDLAFGAGIVLLTFCIVED